MYNIKRQPHTLTACITSSYDLVDKVCSELEGFMSDLGLKWYAFNTLLGVREALINAVGHGAKEKSNTEVCLFAKLEKDILVIKIKDPGEGFDWQKIIASRKERLQKNGALIPERGRGISILMLYFDSVSFNKKGNEVEMHLSVASKDK